MEFSSRAEGETVRVGEPSKARSANLLRSPADTSPAGPYLARNRRSERGFGAKAFSLGLIEVHDSRILTAIILPIPSVIDYRPSNDVLVPVHMQQVHQWRWMLESGASFHFPTRRIATRLFSCKALGISERPHSGKLHREKQSCSSTIIINPGYPY